MKLENIADVLSAPSRRLKRQFITTTGRLDPLHVVVLGYCFYILAGFAVLSLPWAQAMPTDWLDRFLLATSSVTTTGLTPHDPASSYTFLGELALLVMMQIGALGYLTIGTFVSLSLSSRMSKRQVDICRATFGLPEGFDMASVIKKVVLFALIVETLGVIALYPQFVASGVDNPLWAAVFHSVSSFTTSGLSLFATSFENYTDNPLMLMTLAALALTGALGFLVLTEMIELIALRRKSLGFTSRVALLVTVAYVLIGSWVMIKVEPSIAALPAQDQAWNAIFMIVSAGTTVGYNTIPMTTLAPAIIVFMYLIMMFGASPGGTGGGLKSATFAILLALVISTLRRRTRVTLLGLEILPDKIQQATASVGFYCILIGIAIFTLLLFETASIERVLFEAISALSGVGLSMGLTPELSDAGKLLIIALMFIGRVGILAFGIAIVTHDPRDHDPEDAEVIL